MTGLPEKNGVTFNVFGQESALKVNISIVSVYGLIFESRFGRFPYNYFPELQNRDCPMNVQGLCKKTIPKVNINMECIHLRSNRSGKEGFSQLETSLKGEQIEFLNAERIVVL